MHIWSMRRNDWVCSKLHYSSAPVLHCSTLWWSREGWRAGWSTGWQAVMGEIGEMWSLRSGLGSFMACNTAETTFQLTASCNALLEISDMVVGLTAWWMLVFVIIMWWESISWIVLPGSGYIISWSPAPPVEIITNTLTHLNIQNWGKPTSVGRWDEYYIPVLHLLISQLQLSTVSGHKLSL